MQLVPLQTSSDAMVWARYMCLFKLWLGGYCLTYIYIYISIQTVSYCVKIHKHHHFHQQQHICTQSSASVGFMDLIEEFENKEQTAPERLENLRTRSQPLEKD